jgi:hypothetical protein
VKETEMSATATHPRRYRLRSLGVIAAIMVAALAAGTGTAQANTESYNGSLSSAYASSNLSTHKILVSLTARQMSGYYNGQMLSTEVASYDLGTGIWAYSGWRTPSLINGYGTISVCDAFGCEGVGSPHEVPLNGFDLTGKPGHSYNIYVGFAYWTGASYSSVWVLADCIFYWYSQGQTMSAHGNACHT